MSALTSITDVNPSKSDGKCITNSSWQRFLDKLILDRNEAELRPSESLFRSYAALHERIRRLQSIELERDAFLASNDKLQARVRELEGIAANNSVRTAQDVELRQKKDQLQEKLERYMEKESKYYRGLAELNMWQERAQQAEGRITALEEELSCRTSELALVKKEYVSLRDEVELLRDRAIEAEQRAHELDAARRRILELSDELARRPSGAARGRRDTVPEDLSAAPGGLPTGQDPTRLPSRVVCRIDAAHAGSGLRTVCVPDSGNQRFFTAGSDKFIGVWDLAQDRAVLAKSLPSKGMVLSFHSVSHYLLAGCADHAVRFWDTNTMRSLELSGHSEKVVSACLSSTAQYAFSASSDRTIKLWDISRREVLRTLLVESTCNDLAVINDSIVSAHYNGSLVVWDRRSATRTFELSNGHHGPVTCVRISADGRLCISLGKDNILLVRDTRMYTQTLRAVRPPQLTITSNWARFSLSLDAQLAAVGSSHGQVLLLALSQSVEDALLHRVRNTSGASNSVSELVLSVLEGGHEKAYAVHNVAWTVEAPSKLISIGEDRRIVVWE